MKSHPTTNAPTFLCFIFCAVPKDNMFENTVLDESSTTVNESDKEPTKDKKRDTTREETVHEVETIDVMVEKICETSTTVFPVINDSHLQGDIEFNHNIVSLEQGRRTSYLMFDLSPIDSIGGTANTSNLEFTIDSGNGSGIISVAINEPNDNPHKILGRL